MSYARDPYDTDEPPCFCDQEAGPVLTTQEFCPAHGDPAKPAPEPRELCGSCAAGLPMTCTCQPAAEQSFTATRAELLDALTHLTADLPWPPHTRTVALNAESMADAIIEALADRRRHTIHYRWPARCGLPSLPDGDTWSSNFDLVTCHDCRNSRER